MILIEILGQEREGGNCASCGKDYHADNKRRCLVEIENGIIEPASICLDCLDNLKEKKTNRKL